MEKKSKKEYVIGVDIGGTKIRGILLNCETKKAFLSFEELYRQKPVPREEFFRTLFFVIDNLTSEVKTKNCRLRSIGVGLPGLITSTEKIFSDERKFIGINRLNINRIISKKFGVPVVIDNDAKVAAIGEYFAGAGKGSNSMFMVTLGTGVGGAYVKNGILQRGAFDCAYEIWAMTIDAKSVMNNREKRPEWFAGELFFKKKGTTPLEASKKAKRKDKKMIELWNIYGAYVGIGISNIINILEPEIIVISGTITKSWALFSKNMLEFNRKLVISPIARKKTKIKLAKLKNNAGAVGAAYIALLGKNKYDEWHLKTNKK